MTCKLHAACREDHKDAGIAEGLADPAICCECGGKLAGAE